MSGSADSLQKKKKSFKLSKRAIYAIVAGIIVLAIAAVYIIVNFVPKNPAEKMNTSYISAYKSLDAKDIAGLYYKKGTPEYESYLAEIKTGLSTLSELEKMDETSSEYTQILINPNAEQKLALQLQYQSIIAANVKKTSYIIEWKNSHSINFTMSFKFKKDILFTSLPPAVRKMAEDNKVTNIKESLNATIKKEGSKWYFSGEFSNLWGQSEAATWTAPVSGGRSLMKLNSADVPAGGAFNLSEFETLHDIKVVSISDYAFAGLTGLKSVVLNENVKSIGRYAFSNCSNLTSITYPEAQSITIDEGVFYGCTNLGSFVWPAVNKTIPDKTFALCAALSRFTIPDGVISVGNYAFLNCTALANINSPYPTAAQIAEIGGNPAAAAKYYVANIPQSVKMVGDGAFYGNSFATVKLPGAVRLGVDIFALNSALLHAELPAAITEISSGMFNKCTRLKTIGVFGAEVDGVNIPANVQSIGSKAFAETALYGAIVLPEGLNSIGHSAFEGCGYLKGNDDSMVFKDNDGNFILKDKNGAVILKDKNVSKVEKLSENSNTVFNIKNNNGVIIATIKPADASVLQKLVDGCDTQRGITAISYSGGHEKSLLRTIGKNAFNGCDALYDFTMPESLNGIGSNAFNGCAGLRLVWVYASHTTILGEAVFQTEAGIPKFYAPDSKLSKYKSSDNWRRQNLEIYSQGIISDAQGYYAVTQELIDGEYKETLVQYLGNEAQITLPSNIKAIGGGAFAAAINLVNVNFGDAQLEYIGANAFNGCISLVYDICEYLNKNNKLFYINGWLIDGKNDNITSLNFNNVKTAGGITTLGIAGEAMKGSSKLNYVVLNYELKRICTDAFRDCQALFSVTNESSTLKTISSGVFMRCGVLAGMEIPATVEYVGNNAFANCSKLRFVIFYGNNTKIDGNVFTVSDGAEEILPHALNEALHIYVNGYDTKQGGNYTSIYRTDSGWNWYSNLMYDVSVITQMNGSSVAISGTKLIQYLDIEGLPNIGAKENPAVHITIPSNITEIGKGAFAYSFIDTIDISASLQRVDSYAFYSCAKLSLVNFMANGGADSLTYIGDLAFNNCAMFSGSNEGIIRMQADAPAVGFTLGKDVFNSGVYRRVVVSKRSPYVKNDGFWASYALLLDALDDSSYMVRLNTAGGNGVNDTSINTIIKGIPGTEKSFTAKPDTDEGYTVQWYYVHMKFNELGEFIGYYDANGNLISDNFETKTDDLLAAGAIMLVEGSEPKGVTLIGDTKVTYEYGAPYTGILFIAVFTAE